MALLPTAQEKENRRIYLKRKREERRRDRAEYVQRAKKHGISVRQALFYWREFASKKHSHPRLPMAL